MNNITLEEAIMRNVIEIDGIKIASIPIKLMDVDYEYQQNVSKRYVKELTEEWKNEWCGLLICSFRDNKFYIIDGKHRYESAKEKGIETLPCIIYTGLTQHDETLLRRQLNSRSSKKLKKLN